MNTTSLLFTCSMLVSSVPMLSASPSLAPATTVSVSAEESKEIILPSIPKDLQTFEALADAHMSEPEWTVALTVVAFATYPKNKELALKMLEILRGPAGLSATDKKFISDRFLDKDYVPRSYFKGATPDNDYTPSEPATIRVSRHRHSYSREGIADLWIHSGGADSPRPASVRKAKDGKWYLWNYNSILLSIRIPESQNPWQ